MSQTLVLPPSVVTKLYDTCSACQFRHQDTDRDIVCRRYPPAVSIVMVPAPPPRTGIAPMPIASYAPVRDDMRACGEFRGNGRS